MSDDIRTVGQPRGVAAGGTRIRRDRDGQRAVAERAGRTSDAAHGHRDGERSMGRMADAGALDASLSDLLINGRVGVIHLDRRGRVLAANDRARAILRGGDGLVDRASGLHACLTDEDAALQKVLARALPLNGQTGASGSLMLSRKQSAVRLVVHVSPVGEGGAHTRSGRVSALVLVIDPESRWRIDADSVGAILGLTPAEARVAVMLAEGKTIRDIAAATGRSVTTVKWHLGHVFAKTGVSRQADLVRLVLSLAVVPGVGR